MKTSWPIRHQNYLTEVELRGLEGYKSGRIAYGNCAKPGQIARIKLKYARGDKEFYDELLARFKKRFGEPDEWQGDPFQVIICWKWSLRDHSGNRIILHLQHSMDEEYKLGNSVKLTNMTLLEEERSCYEREHPRTAEDERTESARKGRRKPVDYERFIPR